jgi:hypothetical protein
MDMHSRSAWRWPTIIALTATAAVHLALVPDHLHEAFYAGVLFIALSASALALAGVLAISDHELAWLGAGTISVAAVLAYLVSRAVGLPSMSDDVGDWLNPVGVTALACEVTVAAISWRALARGRRLTLVT